jgi:hypothetical protein
MADKIPDYAFNPLRRCLDSIFITNRLLDLSVNGLKIISNRPQMVQRLIDLTVQAGQEVAAELNSEVHDDIWLVSFMDYDLGYFDLETRVLEPLENPFGPKV